MKLIFLKKNKHIIIIGIALFVSYAVYYQWHKGRFTIGTIKKIQPAGNGLRIHISFLYNNVKRERDYIEDVGNVKGLYVGQRVFIKFVPNNLSRSFEFVNCPIPDSIRDSPVEGWSKEWLQKHFPDCK